MLLLVLIVVIIISVIKTIADIPTETKINNKIDKQISENAEWTKKYFNDKYGEGTIK